MRQDEIEERLNLLLLKLVVLQDRIWDGLEVLRVSGKLTPELEEFSRQVMKDVSYWTAQCTLSSESPSILLRRMEVHLSRLNRAVDLIERINIDQNQSNILDK